MDSLVRLQCANLIYCPWQSRSVFSACAEIFGCKHFPKIGNNLSALQVFTCIVPALSQGRPPSLFGGNPREGGRPSSPRSPRGANKNQITYDTFVVKQKSNGGDRGLLQVQSTM